MYIKSSYLFILSVIFIFVLIQCKSKPDENSTTVAQKIVSDEKEIVSPTESEKVDLVEKLPEKKSKPAPAGWSEITADEGFKVDIKYATSDNFTKKQIYDCGRCYLRPEAAEKLRLIHQELKEKYGYGIKVFDCFRPKPYQQRLWDIVPDPDYVTPPHKGSMHSRGLAVDLTIVDKNGVDLDMGTEYDFFGEEAHQDYKGHTPEINKNRSLLKSVMETHGFKSIRTEWWHYSLNSKSYPLDEWVWDCE
jgi:zinc D-Ala-D-Ala dipeptidase